MERSNYRVSLHADLRGLSYHHARVVPSDALAALSRPMKRPVQFNRMVAVAYCRYLEGPSSVQPPPIERIKKDFSTTYKMACMTIMHKLQESP